MRKLLPVAIVCAALMGLSLQAARSQAPRPSSPADSAADVAASTYENLATAIIAIEKTEDDLVRSILIGYFTSARRHLTAAVRDTDGRVAHLEAAAAEIANIANEGDKRIQAVRQRLAKAGHTHNTDVETKADYMFITNREKAGLLGLAQKIAKAEPAEVEGLTDRLSDLFGKAIAPE